MLVFQASCGGVLVRSMAVGGERRPTRVAVIGGGLAGLGCAFHLLNMTANQPMQLDIFDPAEPGCGGASAVAAGLLHPFRPNGREIWMGAEGFEATSELIRAVEQEIGETVSSRSGLLRLAMDGEQADTLQQAAADAEGVDTARPVAMSWHTTAEAELLGGGAGLGGLGAAFAPAALTVDTPRYLRGLWRVCQRLAEAGGGEAAWHARGLSALDELSGGEYDAVVVAAGARTAVDLVELRGLPLRQCRGHNLLLRNDAKLRRPLICGKYLVPLGSEMLVAGVLRRRSCPAPRSLRHTPRAALQQGCASRRERLWVVRQVPPSSMRSRHRHSRRRRSARCARCSPPCTLRLKASRCLACRRACALCRRARTMATCPFAASCHASSRISRGGSGCSAGLDHVG